LFDYLSLGVTRQISILEEKHSRDLAELAQRCTDFEEKYSQGQIELGQVSAALDDANALNSSLHAQLDSKKVIYKTVPCLAVLLLLAWFLKELTFARRKKSVSLLLLVTILTGCIVILAIR
jgi:CHASE2 domain-containing sensor protein